MCHGLSLGQAAALGYEPVHSQGLEGVIMKRKGSIYRPAFRSADWLKMPVRHRPAPWRAKKLARKPPKASPTGDEDDHTGA